MWPTPMGLDPDPLLAGLVSLAFLLFLSIGCLIEVVRRVKRGRGSSVSQSDTDGG